MFVGATTACFVAAVAFSFAPAAQAQVPGDLGLAVNSSLEVAREAVGWSEQSLPVIIMRIVQVAMGFLGILAIVIVLYGGFVWMTAGGDEGKVETAKTILRNGVIGLLLILMAFAIASFVLRMLTGAFGPQPRGIPGRVPACVGCDTLGGGIIEAVYPAPGATDVTRDTMIFVTFKELMNRNTIFQADGTLTDNVKIRYLDPADGKIKDYTGVVNASSPDDQTFVFDPAEYLGDGARNFVYTVDLQNGIRRSNGQPAFPGTPGHFAWSFTVGTRLDLKPPVVKEVFPLPDEQADGYDPTPAVAAVGELTLVSLPRPQQTAAVGAVVVTPGAPAATVSGTYACDTSALICVTASSPADFSISAKESTAVNCSGSDVAVVGLATGARRTPATNPSILLGCGLTLQLDLAGGGPVDGNQWRFLATAGGAADTLRLGSRRYTFVIGAPASLDQIQVGATLVEAANRIRAAVTADASSPVTIVTPPIGERVALRSKVLGTQGNLIDIEPSRTWAQVTPMSGGENATEKAQPRDQDDVARNAVIHLEFSEAMLPTVVAGDVLPPTQVTERADVPGVGTLVDATKPPYLAIQADLDNDGFEADEYIAGKFLISNLYRTVEFRPSTRCGICDVSGVPCASDAQCTGAGGDSCEEQRNSCGDLLYCLPTRSGVTGGVTRYKVSVRAASLKLCSPDPASADACFDANFSECPVGGACRSAGPGGKNYPKAGQPANGVVDAANNSLDGNADYALDGGDLVGPLAEYVLKIPRVPPTSADDGDSLTWTFYVNRNLQLTPPNIVTGGIDPIIDQAPVAILGVPTAEFSSLLMSSSLRPGSNYRDGSCFCSATRSACPTGQTCDVGSGFCRMNDSSAEIAYCQEDSECPNNGAPFANSCVNKRYVSLVDVGRRRVGWWVTSEGRADPAEPPDGYADRTAAQLQHTPFAETTQYGLEYGSGIQDLYQNCYLPSEGPNAAGGRCGTTRAQPYCCSGRPSATPCP